MHDEFAAFVRRPTARTYCAVRDVIVAMPEYSSGVEILARLDGLCRAGRFERARALVNDMMPLWALSPKVHWLASRAASELNDQDDAELETFLMQTCLQGILATGDGGQQRPYLVTYAGDQSAVLGSLRLTPQRQMLVAGRGRQFDVVTSTEGAEIWFDVTELLAGKGITQNSTSSVLGRWTEVTSHR